MSESPLAEETLCSFTSTSSSTYTYGSTTESVKTQIEIALTTTTDLQDAKEESEELFQESVTPTPANEVRIPIIGDVESPSHCDEKYRSYDEEVVQFTAQDPAEDDEEDDDDDDTLSSEAMVDDIELILMPEEAMDLPQVYSPKLVRVRELLTDDDGHLLDEDEDDDCNFRKMDGSERSCDRRGFPTDDGSDDGDEPLMDEVEGAVGFTNLGFGRVECGDDDDPSFASSTTSGIEPRGKYWRKSLASSGVQTDITALEVGHRQPISCDYRFGSGGRKVMTSSSGKKLNWKSELTLLPSKTKVGHHHHFVGLMDDGGSLHTGISVGYNGDREDDGRDQYSTGCGVAKFTSQDNVLSSSSQFLKPSTLYRTRNLSRNLNQLGSSETSFILPEGEAATEGYSPRIRTSWGGVNPISGKGIGCSGTTHRRPTTTAKSFRSSLPDLTPGLGDASKYPAARRRQSHQYTANSRLARQSTSGSGGQGQAFGSSGSGLRKYRKKSSSDEETSSLIDESERCLRSSIDLFLTDDIPPPGYDYPYCSGSSAAGMGRRYCSQPILTEEAYFYREPRNNSMGSPFLPRRMSDMRCSKYAKVILPDGQVSVVSVLEIDEGRDTLKVLPDSGSPIIIPFRKVVFAWRNSRR